MDDNTSPSVTTSASLNPSNPTTSVGTGAHSRIWAYLALLLVDAVILLVIGSGLYFLQQHRNDQQDHSISALSSNINSKIKTLSKQTAELSGQAQLNASYPQNVTLKSLTVTGQTTLSQLDATSTKAGSIVANTINGSTFPGTSITSVSALNNTASSSSSIIALGKQTTGAYVAKLGVLNGLTATDNEGAGSTPTLSVNYGSSADTAVEGNITLTCTGAVSGSNLTGGGNSLTLGVGGSCNSIGLVDDPSFDGTITDTNSTGADLALTGTPLGANDTSLLELGSPIAGGNSNGTYIGLNQSGTADLLNLQTNSVSQLVVDSAGDTTIAGALTVEGSGNNSTTAGVLLQNTSNSTTAFQIKNQDGSFTLFDADTTDGRIGIGNSAPGAYTLDIGSGTSGTVNIGSTLYIDNKPVCTSAGCGTSNTPPSAIDNSTSLQAGAANFFIQSGSSAPTATLEVSSAQVTSQTNVFQILNTNGSTVLDSINYAGNLTVQSATFDGTVTVQNNLTLNGHLITGNSSSGTTTDTAGSNAGTGAITLFNGNDTAGTVQVHSVNGSAGPDLITIGFASDYTGTAPHCVVSADNNASAGLEPYCVATDSSITIGVNITGGTGSYEFDYIITQ